MTSDARKTKAELIEELNRLREKVREDPSRHLAEWAPRPYHCLDAEARVVEVNQAWLNLLGYREDEVLGHWIGDFMDEESRARLEETYPVFLEEGEVNDLEDVYYRRDGTRIVLSLDSKVEQTPDGPIAHTALHDITDMRRARESLAESERRLRGLFESNGDGIIYADVSGYIQNVNSSMCLMLGRTEDELVGKHIGDITSRGDREQEKAFFREQILSGKWCAKYRKKYLHADGHLVPASVRVWADLDEAGDPKGAWALVRDLTDSLEAQAQAARSRELYRLLADNAEGIIWTVNNDLEYTYVSPSVYDLRGVRPEDLIGRNALESMTPESRAKVSRQYWRVIAAEAAGEEVEPQQAEAELLCPDGSTVWVEVQIRILRNQDGERVGFMGSTRNISERKRMELLVRESERSLRTLLEATEDAVGLFSKDGDILSINSNMASLLHRDAKRGQAGSFVEFLPPEVAEKWTATLRRTVDTGRITSIQSVQDGRVFDTVIYPVADETGYIERVAAYAKDVTERIQAEEALKKSEAQYRRIVETVNEGIIGLDADQQVTFVNQRTADFLGYSVAEMLGRRVTDFLLPEERELQEARFHRRASGEQDRYERRFVRRDGEVVWAMVSAAPIKGENGEFIGVFAMVADITESKLAEERRRESEARYRHIFESAVEGLYQSTPEGKFISVNPSLASILGFESPEQVIEEVSDIASQLFVEAEGREKMKRQLREHGAIHDYEVQFRRRDGEILWISINAQLVQDEDGNPVMFEGSVVDISERKRTGEALRLTQFSVDYSPIAIYWIDERGRVVYANESACDSLGHSAEEMREMTLADIDVGNDLEDWDRFWKRQSKNRIGRFETRHRRRDGSTFPVGVTSHFRRYGDVDYLFAYVYDLTERDKAEDALRRGRELLDEVQRISRTGGWEIDLTAGKVQWTENHYRLHGMSSSEAPPMVKEFTERCVHPEDGEAFREKIRIVKRDRIPQEFEYRAVLPDGKEAFLEGMAIPELNKAGDVVRVFGATRDVTRERQAARDLKLSHERLLTILDGIDADIYVSGIENHEVLFMNAHMRQAFGSHPGDMPCHEFFMGEPEQCSYCPKSRLLDENGHAVETLVTERFDPKTNRWHLNHDRAIRWLEGEMVHMHMAADITDIKTMSESLRVAMAEAEAANLAKNEFLANMSHEIRTPLNGLLGMLQLLQLTDLVEEQRDYLNTAMNSGRSLLQILNDILDLSKVESGKLELEAGEFELGEVLDSVVSVFRYHAESRGLEMSWKIDESLPRHFVADKGRLRQILFNLLGNATKFTESGRIEVEAYPLSSPGPDGRTRLFFSVSDTGIGIPENKIGAVFDPFTQVDGSSTRKYQGTGLGLGIVRRLVTLMGGNVSMTSREGEGTVVAFTMLAEPVDQQKREAALGQVCVDGASFSILVAEDERVNQTVVKRLLGKLGHEALCVETGEMALKMLREKSFDCVLMDIQMPGLDGMETTRIIREEMGLDLPVVALTAHAMKGDRDRFLEAGMNGYVAKPFDMAELEAELLRVMGRCR